MTIKRLARYKFEPRFQVSRDELISLLNTAKLLRMNKMANTCATYLRAQPSSNGTDNGPNGGIASEVPTSSNSINVEPKLFQNTQNEDDNVHQMNKQVKPLALILRKSLQLQRPNNGNKNNDIKGHSNHLYSLMPQMPPAQELRKHFGNLGPLLPLVKSEPKQIKRQRNSRQSLTVREVRFCFSRM